MAWWDGLLGWALTTGLAGVGAVGVVAEALHRRRTRPVANLMCDPIGTIDVEGATYRLFTVANVGLGAATIVKVVPVGTTREHPLGDQFLIPSTLAPAERARFAVPDADLTEAYVLLMWTHQPDRRLHIRWQPLDESGSLGVELDRQIEQWRRPAGWLRRRLPGRQRRVGPGGALAAHIRAGDQRRIAAALAPPQEPRPGPPPA